MEAWQKPLTTLENLFSTQFNMGLVYFQQAREERRSQRGKWAVIRRIGVFFFTKMFPVIYASPP